MFLVEVKFIYNLHFDKSTKKGNINQQILIIAGSFTDK
jgi:hypothetical protein